MDAFDDTTIAPAADDKPAKTGKNRGTTPTDKRKLTDRLLRSLPPMPAGQQRVIWDTHTANFGIRLSGNVRTFVFVGRLKGDRTPLRIKLGRFLPDIGGDDEVETEGDDKHQARLGDALSLAEARRLANDVRRDLARGIDPRQAERDRIDKQKRQRKTTFGSVCQDFIDRHVKTLKSARHVENSIKRDLLKSTWKDLPIVSITKEDVVELIEGIIAKRGKPGRTSAAAHQTLSNLKTLFGWACERNYGLKSNPAEKVRPSKLIGKKVPRRRVLKNEEIKKLWHAVEAMDYPAKQLVRLLLVTGLRLREAAWATWSEIDLDAGMWTIPAERMKGKLIHEVPLSPLALDIIKSLPRFQGGQFLFTTSGGRKPLNSFAKLKHRLDDATGFEKHWTLHDIRRSMRTGLSALPIADETRELMIAHAKGGLHAVYDQHRYTAEKAEGFRLWADKLLTIVSPPPAKPDGANIVEFPATKQSAA